MKFILAPTSASTSLTCLCSPSKLSSGPCQSPRLTDSAPTSLPFHWETPIWCDVFWLVLVWNYRPDIRMATHISWLWMRFWMRPNFWTSVWNRSIGSWQRWVCCSSQLWSDGVGVLLETFTQHPSSSTAASVRFEDQPFQWMRSVQKITEKFHKDLDLDDNFICQTQKFSTETGSLLFQYSSKKLYFNKRL